MKASENGHLEIVKLLIENGADISIQQSIALPKMNLNQKETEDFIHAWLPKFPSSPYYYITFIPQDIIDILAPITITPKPDTIIRVLMDYRSLNEPIDVEMFEFPPKIERKGFVVVEWGGVYR